jgi:hypothetical protein
MAKVNITEGVTLPPGVPPELVAAFDWIVTEINQALRSGDTNVDNTEARVDSTDADVTALDTRLTTAEADITTAEGDIDDLEALLHPWPLHLWFIY